MELKKEWSLAYLLLYMCQLSYWLIIIGVGVDLINSATNLTNDPVMIRDVPVHLELEQFGQQNDIELENTYLNIPKLMSSDIHISGPYEEVSSAFYLFNGLKIYKQAVFFLLFFMFAKLLKNVAEGKPFHAKNSSFLYIIGWIFLCSASINIIFQFLNLGYFFRLPILNDLNLPKDIDIITLDLFGNYFILTGIFFIVLGYIFKEGTRIYEEQKLTV